MSQTVLKWATGRKWRKNIFYVSRDVGLKKRWLRAIRRDEGNYFTVNEYTKVCSQHFDSGELEKSLGSRCISLKAGTVPPRFAWSVDSLKKRKPPKPRSVLSKAKNTNTEFIVSQTTETCNSPQLAECVPDVEKGSKGYTDTTY